MTDMTPTLPPLPALPEWSKQDDLGGLVGSEIRQELKAYATAYGEQCARQAVEAACARIKAADDAAAERDYMLDSDDCIKVILGTWTAPMLNDQPQRPATTQASEFNQPMVDMVPPATARDRWMYEQGRLAERDPRTPPAVEARDGWMTLFANSVEALEKEIDAGWSPDARMHVRRLRAALSAAPAAPGRQAVAEPSELTGCACRWDKDDNRVQTCERHQGWLDVVREWSERAKAAEPAPQQASAQGEQAQQASAQPTQAAKDVLLFLLGEGRLDGWWWGEKPSGRAPFWWRKHLRASFESLLRASKTGEPS